jgi:hypothetical protein
VLTEPDIIAVGDRGSRTSRFTLGAQSLQQKSQDPS